MRIIVKFRTATAYKDAQFLADLSGQVGAHLIYLTSVSADTHVYRVELPHGESAAAIVARLSAHPAVAHAEPDAMARPSR